MIRSDRYARWWGFTRLLRKLEQPPAPSSARPRTRPRTASLENDGEPTGVLLEIAGVVGVEEHVVAKIEAQGDPLLEREQDPSAHVRGAEIGYILRRLELIGLPALVRATAAQREERRDRRRRPE